MNPSSPQFSNVRVLRNLSHQGSITAPSFQQSLGNINVGLNKWHNEGKPEVTAHAGTVVKKATGETTSEARQKAYNAASTQRAEEIKSGAHAKKEAERTTFNDVTPKKTIKVKSN
jgi:hypothetical protein